MAVSNKQTSVSFHTQIYSVKITKILHSHEKKIVLLLLLALSCTFMLNHFRSDIGSIMHAHKTGGGGGGGGVEKTVIGERQSDLYNYNLLPAVRGENWRPPISWNDMLSQ